MSSRSARRATAAVGLTLCVLALALAAWAAPAGTQAPDLTVPPGSIVVALRTLGQVNAVLPDGEVRVLARGLAEPSAVAVLEDGTVLVAEAGADRVSAFGGRFGAAPEAVAQLPAPSGLAVASDGAVYVTSPGEVGRIDLAGRRYETIAGGFTFATGPAVREGVLYVPDFDTGEVISVDVVSGARLATVASGLVSPAGAATAPGLPLFVSEAAGNRIVRIDASGAPPSTFATVQGPLQLALDPAAPTGADWLLVVATAEGLVRLDSEGEVAGTRTALPLSAGVAVTPEPPASGAGAERAPTVVREDGGDDASPLLLIAATVLVVAVVAVVVTVVLARRAKQREQEVDGVLAPPPEYPGGVGVVFGGCSEEEREVDRLRTELERVSLGREAMEAQARTAVDLASRARDRAMRALEVRASFRAKRQRGERVDDGSPLTWAQLTFVTNEGRAAFEAFRRRELTPAQLRARFEQLGEHAAVAQIVAEGRRRMRRDPDIPWPEERDAVREAIAAREELRAHERDAELARAEAGRLAERERELRAELDAAIRRLEDCRRALFDTA